MYNEKERGRDMMKKLIMCLICMLLIMSGCSSSQSYPSDYPSSPAVKMDEVLDIDVPQTDIKENDLYIVDYSKRNNGYITVRKKNNNEKLKIQIIKDEFAYTYDVDSNEFVGLPLQMQDGEYTIRVARNVVQKDYAIIDSFSINVTLESELEPYLYPNKIINYKKVSQVVKTSMDVCKNLDNDLQRIEKCYTWVINNMEYDENKVSEANSKYLIPDLDEVLEEKKGICFDYASLLCAMLRVQNIPTRVVCGNTDIDYHAWIEVYLEGKGWVNPDIFIDEKIWSRMDPTFADSKYDYDGTYEAIYYY